MQQHSGILYQRREIWKQRAILKRLYQHWCQMIETALKPGSILEIGGGSGNLKEFFPYAISSDVVFTPWADAVLNAHHLPFHGESFDNIILFDVLHHLNEPSRFFYEAQNVLKYKGRIVLIEPYVSLASFFIYRFLHSEGLALDINPFKKDCLGKNKNRFHGNQAIPTLIFEKYKHWFVRDFPGLKVIKKDRMDFIVYPLSGGFHNPCLCPLFLYSTFRYLEKILHPLNRFLAFRIFVVLEKN